MTVTIDLTANYYLGIEKRARNTIFNAFATLVSADTQRTWTANNSAIIAGTP